MSATYRTTCSNCSKRLRVPETALGQLVRCPACGHTFEVKDIRPAGQPTPEPVPVQAARETAVRAEDDSDADNTCDPDFSVEGRTGQLVGRFQVRAAVGQGAFGRVYRAYDPDHDRYVALKIPTFGPNQDVRVKRFLREAASTARLRHRNIVATFESGETDDCYYLISEFIDGELLSERIKRGKMPVQDAVRCAWRLADALAYAHSQGVIHRDIKPQNIMLDSAGEPKLMDFGLAKDLDDEAGITTDGALLGTPAYMSPEQARGDVAKIGPASDQYSLAVVLYQLLTGSKPFSGPQHMVIAQVASNTPPPVRTVDPSLPADLDAICRKAMQREPEQRYMTCADMAADLHDWLQCRPVRVGSMSTVRRALHTLRSHAPLIVMSTITIGLLAVIGWAAMRPGPDDNTPSVVDVSAAGAENSNDAGGTPNTTQSGNAATSGETPPDPTLTGTQAGEPTQSTATTSGGRDDTGQNSQTDDAVAKTGEAPPNAALSAQNVPPTAVMPSPDRTQFVGSHACIDCHRSEYIAWSRSKHATGGGLNRLDSRVATRFKDRKDFRNMDKCVVCHTATAPDSFVASTTETGTSCESCHGAAGGSDGWLAVHAVYSDHSAVDRTQESAEHLAHRQAKQDEAGMIRPERLYETVRNCFGCHIIGDESIVGEEVGHKAWAQDFDLMSWVQGEVRHNFFLDQHHNADVPTLHQIRTDRTTREHQRLTLVISQFAKMEVCLRNLAAVESDDNLESEHAGAWKHAMDDAVGLLEEIVEIIEEPPDGILAVEEATLRDSQAVIEKLGRKYKDLTRVNAAASADEIARLAQVFLSTHDGSKLSALDDEFLDEPGIPKGEPLEPQSLRQAQRSEDSR